MKINMDNVFSEVMYLYDNEYRYWFNRAEIDVLHQRNQDFQIQMTEYEMIVLHFTLPSTDDNKEESFLTTSQIMNTLKRFTNLNLAEKRIGEALKKLEYERKSKRVRGNPIYGWNIKLIGTDIL